MSFSRFKTASFSSLSQKSFTTHLHIENSNNMQLSKMFTGEIMMLQLQVPHILLRRIYFTFFWSRYISPQLSVAWDCSGLCLLPFIYISMRFVPEYA